MLIVWISRAIYCIYLYNFKYDYWKNKIIEIKIDEIISVDEEDVEYSVKYNNDKFVLYLKNDGNIYEHGQKLKILSSNYEIKKYGNPYEFDYKRYLNSKGIVSRLYCNKIIEKGDVKKDLKSIIYYIRNSISKKLDNNLNTTISNFIKSITYGDDTYLDKDLKELFSNVGLGHVLCVSGTHVLFLIASYEFIIKDKKHKKIEMVMLIYFYSISLFNLSLFRAICMEVLKNTTKFSFKKRYAITLYLVLLVNPYNIFNVGVIFSFLSVLGIHLFYNLFFSYFKVNLKLKRKFAIKIYSNISLTISSQVLIFPFLIYYFQKISLIAILSNMLVIVILNILLLNCFILFILFFIPILSTILIHCCNILSNIFIFEVKILDKINFLDVKVPKINISIMILYYLLVIIVLYGKNIKFISWKYRKNIDVTMKVFCILTVTYFFTWYIKTMYFEKYVIFFNVGQGNMALIHNNTTNIIVDIGSTRENNAGNIITNFLKAKNIENIDAVFITHMHSDHVNGIYNLIAEANVKRVCFSIPVEENEYYYDICKILREKGISKVILNEDDMFIFDGISVDVLFSTPYSYIKDSDMLNANSTVFLVKSNGSNYLFMGDSTKKTENYIAKKYLDCKKINKIKAYQVSHHGSKTSSLEYFISNMPVCSAIISADKQVYGHPDNETIEILQKYNFKIYITQKEGAIKF